MKHTAWWLCIWIFNMNTRTKWDIKNTKKDKSDADLVKYSLTPIFKFLLVRNNAFDENEKNKNY